MFVSWSNRTIWGDKILKVWDAVTGTPISTIKGNGGSFEIANDFSTVASFENKAITLYNVKGSEHGVTLTTSAKVLKVAISSGGLNRIAAGLSDGTVSLWDTRDSQDGKPIGSFGDYRDDGYRGSLEFSATGARLAYNTSAKKGVVKLLNVIKGEFVADLDWESALSRDLFWLNKDCAFSRDGSRIVSWQSSGVKLWDCGDGQPVGTIEKEMEYHYTVAISDTGSFLAIGYKTLEVWSGNRGNLSQVVNLPYDHVSPLAFSPDDTLAIGTNFDVKLYSIKNRSFLSTLSISSRVLAFSPDCTRFAVGNFNSTGVSLL
ncbi:hypothetical protein M378DRAFT_14574 [Amanita muscaria Koide BX008]|uniref:Uncharacterized protein n=1 Tax=Amanita muscaria (strain Koide BX008) TaxID=946122 RepID=A0A0C2WEK8_AMAMK|nr:hypothetical protein M378DRAFT_14574 [Amanita muscaria Koide BX008]